MILFFRNILKYVNYNILGKEKYIRTISKRNIFEFANFLFQLCKVTFETFILKKVYIPYVEVAVTTRCSLKCKHCSYYIPITDEKCHSSISFEEYKLYIDNLLKNIVSLQTLTLIGGEPLLNKDFDKILIYSLYHKKIESVYIVSNGTIDFREDLTTILKKFSNKAVVWLSNYLSNEDLLPKLKTTNIIKNLMESGVTVHCLASQWYPVSQIRYNNRSKPENEKYFSNCPQNRCVHVRKNLLSVCPRAAFFMSSGICKQQKNEYLDLSLPVEKKDIISFYSNSDFSACRFCNILEDANMPSVIPAQQI